MKNIIKTLMICGVLLWTSCNDFLDQIPDNRSEVNTENAIQKLLVSAYPRYSYQMVAEMAADNVDDMSDYFAFERYYETIFYWGHPQESDNESLSNIWSGYYQSIQSANLAIEKIREAGMPANLTPYYGEAMLCRAFAHFILVNIFCKQYNDATSSTDLGIPYMDYLVNELKHKEDRGNVADVYVKIEKDLIEGLKYLDETVYTVPKYHFNVRAAHAFASRFYLYMGEWEKVIEHATTVLGDNPASILRPMATFNALPTANGWTSEAAKAWPSPDYSCNLMLMAPNSFLNQVFSNQNAKKRFITHRVLSWNELYFPPAPWNPAGGSGGSWYRVWQVNTHANSAYVWKLPRYFEYIDVAKTRGYNKGVFNVFCSDEVLLERAEAYVMLDRYDAAIRDLNIWQDSWMNLSASNLRYMTVDNIDQFYSGISYYESEPGLNTIKKHLNPPHSKYKEGWSEGSLKEHMIQAIVHTRRYTLTQEGYRWFDVRRWGIEITRRSFDRNGNYLEEVDVLTPEDPRRAFQIPYDVLAAGVTPNPR